MIALIVSLTLTITFRLAMHESFALIPVLDYRLELRFWVVIALIVSLTLIVLSPGIRHKSQP